MVATHPPSPCTCAGALLRATDGRGADGRQGHRCVQLKVAEAQGVALRVKSCKLELVPRLRGLCTKGAGLGPGSTVLLLKTPSSCKPELLLGQSAGLCVLRLVALLQAGACRQSTALVSSPKHVVRALHLCA